MAMQRGRQNWTKATHVTHTQAVALITSRSLDATSSLLAKVKESHLQKTDVRNYKIVLLPQFHHSLSKFPTLHHTFAGDIQVPNQCFTIFQVLQPLFHVSAWQTLSWLVKDLPTNLPRVVIQLECSDHMACTKCWIQPMVNQFHINTAYHTNINSIDLKELKSRSDRINREGKCNPACVREWLVKMVALRRQANLHPGVFQVASYFLPKWHHFHSMSHKLVWLTSLRLVYHDQILRQK